MKIALLQMNIQLYDREANKHKVRSMLEQAMGKAPELDLVILPELWTFPFLFKEDKESMTRQLAEYGEEYEGETLQFVSEMAATHNVWIVAGSLPLKNPDGTFGNTTVIFDRRGKIMEKYSKVHLCEWCGETNAFEKGNEITVADTEIGRIAPIICYDIRFPELARTAALKGAELLVVASDFGHDPKEPKVDIWRTLLKARAIENMMFVAACDRCGTGPESSYFGHSMIIDPYGRVIAEGGEEEEVVIGEIDCRLVEEARRKIPVWQDRRPEVYSLEKQI